VLFHIFLKIFLNFWLKKRCLAPHERLATPQAGLELLQASDPDFDPTAAAAGDAHWAGLGPDGTCEPWKRSPRKKKLCVTYRFDPNTQAKSHCKA
jgi:hypothetical protein